MIPRLANVQVIVNPIRDIKLINSINLENIILMVERLIKTTHQIEYTNKNKLQYKS